MQEGSIARKLLTSLRHLNCPKVTRFLAEKSLKDGSIRQNYLLAKNYTIKGEKSPIRR